MSKNQPANPAGGPVGTVLVMPVHIQGEQVPAHYRAEVNPQELLGAKQEFENGPEEIEADHVQGQVTPVGMQETRGDQAIILFPAQYAFRIEDEPLLQFRSGEGRTGKSD